MSKESTNGFGEGECASSFRVKNQKPIMLFPLDLKWAHITVKLNPLRDCCHDTHHRSTMHCDCSTFGCLK
ncbi:conserved hypothetical protein [Ricinus communis]|uniref:Uncharacterized protein n=1 Tax=Ricinus communis TaxID=3988 RepID=B9S0X6_RICCO|nr:conserved hypothetical protein [Ricinus communis]